MTHEELLGFDCSKGKLFHAASHVCHLSVLCRNYCTEYLLFSDSISCLALCWSLILWLVHIATCSSYLPSLYISPQYATHMFHMESILFRCYMISIAVSPWVWLHVGRCCQSSVTEPQIPSYFSSCAFSYRVTHFSQVSKAITHTKVSGYIQSNIADCRDIYTLPIPISLNYFSFFFLGHSQQLTQQEVCVFPSPVLWLRTRVSGLF